MGEGGQRVLPAFYFVSAMSRTIPLEFSAAIPESCLRQTPCVLYLALDPLLPLGGKSTAGFDEFTAALDHAGIPAVWLTSRSRLQIDEPRRKYGHAHPFVAEDGCGVYLPEDYFHLRPEASGSRHRRSGKGSTLRLGRFTCIPIAQPLPAAAEVLESLSVETGVPIVTLQSLSLRELAQNTGLLARQAELARQRDFDELFFFAGASNEQVTQFLAEGGKKGVEFRPHGAVWSAAIGTSMKRCISELSRLYDRALRYHATSVAAATADSAPGLFPFCDRSILLAENKDKSSAPHGTSYRQAREIHLLGRWWEQLLEVIGVKP